MNRLPANNNYMGISEITAMSHEERVETMELLWAAMTHDSSELESPSWHEGVLDDRRKRIESGEAKFYTLEEAQDMLNNA